MHPSGHGQTSDNSHQRTKLMRELPGTWCDSVFSRLMDPVGFIVFFICIWWILYYMALPIGRQRDFDVNGVGAPRKPRLLLKAGVVTAITTVIMVTLVLLDFGTYLDLFINGEL